MCGDLKECMVCVSRGSMVMYIKGCVVFQMGANGDV